LIQKRTGPFRRPPRTAGRHGSRASLSRPSRPVAREGFACPNGHAGQCT